MLWSNASEFCLLCSIYAPYVKYYALKVQHLILLNHKFMSISSLSISSTIQHTINNSSTYVCIFNSLTSFLLHLQLYSVQILTKSLPLIHPNLTILWKIHFTQILSIVPTIFAYYAGIVLNAFAFLLCSKLCWHNRLKPNM